MAVKPGRTRPDELRLHLDLTYAPKNTSSVLDRASGRQPMTNGRNLAGAAQSAAVKAAEAGRTVAEAALFTVAEQIAGWASGQYAALNYDLTAAPKRQGSGWRLAVDGPGDAQKWARIAEVGYAPQDVHQFIEGAAKKRAIKIKPGEIPGFYLIVPKMHGKVSKNQNGKLVYTAKRDGRLGTWVDPKILRQFEAKPLTPTVRATFGESDPATYGVDELVAQRNAGYNPAAETGEWGVDASGKKVPLYQGQRTQVGDNHHWESDRMVQRIRRAGVLVNTPAPRPGKPGATSEGYTKTHPSGAPLPNISNRDGARLIASVNKRAEGGSLVRTGVNNLRFVALDARYDDLGDDEPAQQRMVARRGDVLSFLTLSTRRPNYQPRPGKPGHHVLRRAAVRMDAQILGLIQQAESERRAGFNRDAYLEVLRSALGRAL